MKGIARKYAVALAATVASFASFAPLPARAGSEVVDGTDYIVTAATNETYTISTPIGNYARLVKRGAGEVKLTEGTADFAGTAVVEEGTLSITHLLALGTSSPVVVSNGATFYLKTQRPNGARQDTALFCAHELTIAGDGVDGKGAIRYLPTGGGAADDSLLGVINLAADATIECDYRWGVHGKNNGVVNLNGHRLRRIRNSSNDQPWMLNGATVDGTGTVEAYKGTITFQGGVTSSANATYVATNSGSLTIYQTTKDIPSALTFFPERTFTVAAGANEDHNRFSGPIRLANHAGSAADGRVTFAFSANSPAAAVLHLDGPIAGDAGMSFSVSRKASGDGSLFLNGDVSIGGPWVYVNGGTFLAMTSGATRAFATGIGVNGGSRMLVGGGHTRIDQIGVGTDPTKGKGSFRQTGGVFVVTNNAVVGGSALNVGHWAMSGGEAYASNNVHVANSAGSFGSFVQTGGRFKLEGGSLYAGNAGTAVFHVAGGTNDTWVAPDGQIPRFRVGESGGSSDVTVSGEGTLLATETLRFGGSVAASTNVFTVKDGATVKARRFRKNNPVAAGTLVHVNADGGTLMPTFGYGWTDLDWNKPGYYDNNPDHFVVWSKGLVIDTSESGGNDPNCHMPFSFESPSGKGVESIALPTDEAFTNAVYLGPARIVFEDGTGWGASAYAEYDYDAKKLANVVVTSRGCDYGDGAKAYLESPDRTARWECALVLSDNAGLAGELVKRGEQALYLRAANTTTGGIAVEEGTLFAETAGVVPYGTPVRVEHGATLWLPDATPITLSTFTGSGTLADGTGLGVAVLVTNAVRASCADLFAGRYEAFPASLTFAPGATFTITDPENLATYSHSPAVTAFTARHVAGEQPRLAFEGEVPPGSGTWSLAARGGGRYTFGPVVGTIILVR